MQYSARKELENNVVKTKIHFFTNDASYHHITSTWKFRFGDNILLHSINSVSVLLNF